MIKTSISFALASFVESTLLQNFAVPLSVTMLFILFPPRHCDSESFEPGVLDVLC